MSAPAVCILLVTMLLYSMATIPKQSAYLAVAWRLECAGQFVLQSAGGMRHGFARSTSKRLDGSHF